MGDYFKAVVVVAAEKRKTQSDTFCSVKHGAVHEDGAWKRETKQGGTQNRKERDRGRSAHPKAKKQM